MSNPKQRKINLMLGGVKIAELKPTGLRYLVAKTEKTSMHFKDFSGRLWFEEVGYSELAKLTEIIAILRQEYIFSLLNPEE